MLSLLVRDAFLTNRPRVLCYFLQAVQSVSALKQALLRLEVVGETFSFNELMRRDFWGLPMHGLESHRSC